MQRFQKGDLVRVAKDLGPSMRHFTGDCEAVVTGSYADQFGGGDTHGYTLHLKGRGQVSWYDEEQLTLVEKSRADLLDVWAKEEKETKQRESNLDWIFQRGPELLKSAPGHSVQALADSLGLGSLWGSRGEGIDWYCNAETVMLVARPFLEKHDKEGWLAFAAEKPIAWKRRVP